MVSPVKTSFRPDHLGITVPDLDAAVQFFVDTLGARLLYAEGPVRDDAEWMQRQLGVHLRAELHAAMLEMPGGFRLELFEYSAPDQSQAWPRNSDWGGCHLALEVPDIHIAADRLRIMPGVEVMGEVHDTEEAPGAVVQWIYFTTPWGMQLELVSPKT
jgi:catechol 2,3-dioxygenase-like lactoylglutathione lyase family enzyme